MRQDHKGGEKLFVDYGEGLSLIDRKAAIRPSVSGILCVKQWLL
jgi:hypothetical protein